MNPLPLFMMPGATELLVILAVVVLLFGANRLPELANASGRALGEFHRGREEVERDVRTAARAAETETPAAEPVDATER